MLAPASRAYGRGLFACGKSAGSMAAKAPKHLRQAEKLLIISALNECGGRSAKPYLGPRTKGGGYTSQHDRLVENAAGAKQKVKYIK